jgi:hypothetical protein
LQQRYGIGKRLRPHAESESLDELKWHANKHDDDGQKQYVSSKVVLNPERLTKRDAQEERHNK